MAPFDLFIFISTWFGSNRKRIKFCQYLPYCVLVCRLKRVLSSEIRCSLRWLVRAPYASSVCTFTFSEFNRCQLMRWLLPCCRCVPPIRAVAVISHFNEKSSGLVVQRCQAQTTDHLSWWQCLFFSFSISAQPFIPTWIILLCGAFIMLLLRHSFIYFLSFGPLLSESHCYRRAAFFISQFRSEITFFQFRLNFVIRKFLFIIAPLLVRFVLLFVFHLAASRVVLSRSHTIIAHPPLITSNNLGGLRVHLL